MKKTIFFLLISVSVFGQRIGLINQDTLTLPKSKMAAIAEKDSSLQLIMPNGKVKRIANFSDIKAKVFDNIEALKSNRGYAGEKASTLGYWEKGDSPENNFYWNIASTEADNGGTIIQVSGVSVGRWKRLVENNYYFEWFGAKGDGITNDSAAIVNAINFVASLPKGGTIQLLDKTYLTGKFFLKKGVNLIGAEKNLAAGASITTQVGSTIKNIQSNYFVNNFVELFPDNSYTQQVGEDDGLNKSYPNFSVTNITFDANGSANFAVNISKAWGFTLDKCKFSNAKAYGLHIYDCNEFYVTNCAISRFLSTSNADYLIYGNDLVGSTKFPALYFDRSGVGSFGNNKIYFGGDSTTFYNFVPTSIMAGVIKVNKYNHLTEQPNYAISGGAGSLTFARNTQTLAVSSVNGQSVIAFANLANILEVGKTYKLSGQMQLSGASSSRSMSFGCGNNTQTYNTSTVTTSLQTISFSFVFSPTGNALTSPLRISIVGATITGTDIITFTNLKITSDFSRLNGIPMVFDYPSTVSTDLKNSFPHSECYYPKWLSDSTMVLFTNLAAYKNNSSGYVNITEASISGASINVPNCVMFVGGRASNSGTYTNNKVEDIIRNGVIFRGVYNNVFSGNKVSKGSGYLTDSLTTLISLIKGAERNTITSNAISARTQDINDLIGIGIYCDNFSGANLLTANTIKNCNYFDIFDDYIGEAISENKYDKNSLSESFVYKRKSVDFVYKGKGITFEKSKISNLTNGTTLIDNTEFSLHFENVKVSSLTGNAALFQQKDITNSSQNGRFSVSISSSGQVYCVINASIVLITASSVIVANKFYNITITKDLLNVWKIYVDGTLLVSASYSAVAVATGGSTKSYVSSGDGSQGAEVFMSGFKSFTEPLSEIEIKNLNYQGSINNSVSTLLLTSKSAGTSFFSPITAGSITLDTGTGIDGGNSLKATSSLNNLYTFNIPSATVKGKLIRISGYVKSNTITGINSIRNLKAKNIIVSPNYRRFTEYISVENTSSGNDIFIFRFGKLDAFTYGKTFYPTAGDTFLDYLKVSSGVYPCNSEINFTTDPINRAYSNTINTGNLFTMSDTFSYFVTKEQGTVTLSGGTATVSATTVKSTSFINITRDTPSGTLGQLSVPTSSIVDGTSFIINSSTSENSTIKWVILK